MNTKPELQILEEKLQLVMNREIVALREILANLQSEQHSLLVDDNATVQAALSMRGPLIEVMKHWRIKMIKEIKGLGEHLHLDMTNNKDLLLEEWMSMIVEIIGEDNCEILCLRDQILALVDKIDRQNRRNHFLMDLKVADRNNPYRATKQQSEVKPKRTTVITMELDEEE